MARKTGTMSPWIAAIIGVVLLGAGPAAHAMKTYKWVDKDGNVTYQDSPPPGGAAQVEEQDIAAPPPTDAQKAATEDAAAKNPVTLYLAPDCLACDAAKAYLTKRHIPFTEKNADNNRKVQAEMQKKIGSVTVPTILIGDKVMKGYVESLLASELDAAGYPNPEQQPAPTGEAAGGEPNNNPDTNNGTGEPPPAGQQP